jgi:hypothetical protein
VHIGVDASLASISYGEITWYQAIGKFCLQTLYNLVFKKIVALWSYAPA